MKWSDELSFFVNDGPQTFDIHTIAIAVAIVPFQKTGKANCAVSPKARFHHDIPPFDGFCYILICGRRFYFRKVLILYLNINLSRIITQLMQQVIDNRPFTILDLKNVTIWNTERENAIGYLFDVIVICCKDNVFFPILPNYSSLIC